MLGRAVLRVRVERMEEALAAFTTHADPDGKKVLAGNAGSSAGASARRTTERRRKGPAASAGP